MRIVRRSTVAPLGAVILGAVVAVAPAQPALAAGFCLTPTPQLEEVVLCPGIGGFNVLVPVGADKVALEVIGGGGGGGTGSVSAGNGGWGNVVRGVATWPANTAKLRVVVGAGGVGGAPGVSSSVGGGAGGEGSGVYAWDSGNIRVSTLVIAAGGGGGGGSDSASTVGTGDGGDGDQPGALVELSPVSSGQGGGPGTAYTPGAGGSGSAVSGSTGQYRTSEVVAGGSGATVDTAIRGGGGGGGITGGGGGGADSIGANAYLGGGGGGGASFTNPIHMPNPEPIIAASASAGAGARGTGNVGTNGLNGGGGVVSLIFGTAPTITTVTPSTGLLAGNETVTIAGTTLKHTTEVTIGGQVCANPVPTSTQVTCTTPAGLGTGAQDVKVTTLFGAVTKPASFTYQNPPSIASVVPPSGPLTGSQTLTVAGTGLDDPTSVKIGADTCLVVTESDTQITCTRPPGTAGVRDVVVTTAEGTDTEAGGYTYVAPPSITSVAPAHGPVGGGTTLTITGTDLDTASAVTVDGASCTGLVPGPSQVTCTAPAAVHGPGKRDVVVTTVGGTDTETESFRYIGPPVIASVAPTVGPLAGGNTLTVQGQDLDTVGWVRVGGELCGSMVPAETSVTCVVPAGATPGRVAVAASAAAGVDSRPDAYEYLPAPAPTTVPPPPTTAPTPAPTTPAPTTPAPTTPAPTTPPPTTEPTAPPQLNLTLAIRPGAPVRGAAASVSGGGLRANSQFTVTLYSSPVRLASGYADASGSFAARFTLPARACVKGGLHRVVLSGFAPDGTVVTTTNWLLFDDSCATRTVSPAKPATVTYGTFRFRYASAALTPYVRSVLTRTHSTLRSAKAVTITGYTQTGSRSEASRAANRALALRRAQAVRSYLRELGVRGPITVVGAGAVNPLQGRPQSWNRRVFITARY